jgi:predicted metal-binding membrane protein
VPSTAGLARRHSGALAALMLAALLGWAVLAWAALDMSNPLAQMMMPMSAMWSATNALAVWAMWAVMMAAMMLPTATPMVLVFASLARKQPSGMAGAWTTTVRLWAFVGAYLLIWIAFSAVAAAGQWTLQAAGLLSPMMLASLNPYLTAALLALAGLFQFTRLKTVCLTNCRSPLGFLMTEWRDGWHGAFVMGVRHGLFCVGCCWAMMVLLFAFGIMNLPWVALLAALVAVEKLAPRGDAVARLLGAAMLAAGGGRVLMEVAT